MNTNTYQDLLFWKSAFNVSQLIIQLISKIPKNTTNQIISNQVLRSSMSVGANIAEGYGRFGPKEYPRYLQVALGSANETEHWLLLLKESNLKFIPQIEIIILKNKESIKMLAASIKTIRNK